MGSSCYGSSWWPAWQYHFHCCAQFPCHHMMEKEWWVKPYGSPRNWAHHSLPVLVSLQILLSKWSMRWLTQKSKTNSHHLLWYRAPRQMLPALNKLQVPVLENPLCFRGWSSVPHGYSHSAPWKLQVPWKIQKISIKMILNLDIVFLFYFLFHLSRSQSGIIHF